MESIQGLFRALHGALIYHGEALFVVRLGGDGPKRLIVEEMRDKYRLHSRVQILGENPRGGEFKKHEGSQYTQSAFVPRHPFIMWSPI